MCLGPPGGWCWPLARRSEGVFVPDAGEHASPPTRLHRVTRARPFLLALVLIGTAEAPPLFAQSTAGSISGTIRDEQLAVIAGADITLVDAQTGHARTMRSGATGDYRFLGLTPGRYGLRVERPGFLTESVPDITLHVGQQLQIDATLAVAGVTGAVTVEPRPAVETATTLARTVRRAEIDQLPVQDRGYTNLALLAPGVLENRTNPGSSAPVVTAGQTGRNDTFLLDGFSLDYSALGSVWGDVPIDAISEFGVLTSGFGAEFGQASGAIVTIVTRSGSNLLAGRAYYYHRDHALDARPAASDLLGPSATPASFEQKTPGGYAGGPIARDHAFFFASAEGSLTDSQHVISSSALHDFRPDAPAIVPTPDDNWEAFGRADINTRSDALMFQYRFHRESMANRFGQADLQLGAPERAGPASGWSEDVAFADTHVLSATRLNDFRLQVSRLGFLLDTNCPGCVAENRPSIRLGGNPALPNRQDERRLQLLDTFTWASGRTGVRDHVVKVGTDVNLLNTDWDALQNGNGTFLFGTDRPFDPRDLATYPLRYTRTTGTPTLTLPHQTYAVFVEDQWRPASSLTLNLGLRWDRAVLENGPFGAGDVAPRLGAAFAPGDGQTVVRASYGRYIDQVPLAVVAAATQAVSSTQITIFNPGYPDPLGPNPRRSTSPVAVTPSVTTLADQLPAPFTDQGALGLVRQLGRLGALSADFVLARGHRLLVTHDLNYPDLTDPSRPRPDPRFQQILQVQSTGRSWYRALQVQLVRRESHGYAYSVAYTWSSAERDTEDWDFVPQDQRDYAADRGPSASDVPHQLVASFGADLPFGLRLATVATGRSGIPYDITTGLDNNRDGNFNDRPPGVGRNSAREAPFWQVDLRVSKQFRTGRYALELLAEAFNLFNRRNWTGYVGDQSSVLFGTPTGADIARQVQLGVRVDF
jgi:Carboxypeptidase regulatory-like domain/TonB dependent receptor-like, beta-barrel